MNTQALVITNQVLSMKVKENRDVGPYVNQNASTMVSRLRDFNMMYPTIFFGSMIYEEPKEFFDEVYKILFCIGVSSNEKVELAAYQLKVVLKYGILDGRTIRL